VNAIRPRLVSDYPTAVWHAAMVLAIAFGTYVRFKGLGQWPLTMDEYYIFKPIQNILRLGVPAFECGGYYVRALLYQYAMAPLIAAGLGAEFSLRLAAALSNLLAIPAIYWLGKRLSGRTVACASVILFSLSLWEIEFSRFGRMYAPFQTVFVWYLVFLHRCVVDQDKASARWMYAFSVLGIFLWEGGIFLALLNFTPLLFRLNYTPIKEVLGKDFLVSIAILLLSTAYMTSVFWFGGSSESNHFPQDLSAIPRHGSASEGPFPLMLWETLSSHREWLLPFLLVVTGSAWAIYRVCRQAALPFAPRLGLAIVIALSVANLFGLAIGCIVLLVLLNWINPRSLPLPALRIAAIAAAASFIFWVAYGLATDTWHRFFPPFGSEQLLKKLFVVLFKYPNILDQIVYPWLAAIPLTVMLFGALSAIATVIAVFGGHGRENTALRIMLFILALLTLCIGALDTKDTTRYTFFLVPVLFLTSATALYKSISVSLPGRNLREITYGLAMAMLIWLSDDFRLDHMLRIDSMEINYRLVYDEAKKNHYFPRFDYRTPAEYVNRQRGEADVVINSLPPTNHYLDRMDYYYINDQHWDFWHVSCDLGSKDRWSNAPLIHSPQALFNLVESAETTVWLLLRHNYWFDNDIYTRYRENIVYKSVDGVFDVYRIDKSKARRQVPIVVEIR
jgi:hypothetical protein